MREANDDIQFDNPASVFRRGDDIRPPPVATVAALLFFALLCGCSTQPKPQMPITAQQRAELDRLAASKDSPEGLKEALAEVDTIQKQQACQDQARVVAQQMQMLGMASGGILGAGRLVGNGGATATRMMAVMQAQSIQARMAKLPSCAEPQS